MWHYEKNERGWFSVYRGACPLAMAEFKVESLVIDYCDYWNVKERELPTRYKLMVIQGGKK